MKYLYQGEHREGTHGFAGQCAPSAYGLGAHETFSVGIFQWVTKADGKGLKRGKVLMRVRGLATGDGRERVLRRAKDICRLLDAGEYGGRKTVMVW